MNSNLQPILPPYRSEADDSASVTAGGSHVSIRIYPFKAAETRDADLLQEALPASTVRHDLVRRIRNLIAGECYETGDRLDAAAAALSRRI